MTANNYYVDLLFRQNANPAAETGASVLAPVNNGSNAMVTGLSDQRMRAEASTILAEGAVNGGIPPADNAYLTQLVSARTGLAPADAHTRVNAVLAQEQADEVRSNR